MRLWDCFPYWREDVLAEARRRLWATAAVRVESVAFVGDRTHRGDPYTGPPVPPGIRIEAVTLDAATAWGRESQQRDAVVRLLPEMAADDVVLLCDVDEFVNPAAVWPIVMACERGPAALAMDAFYCGTRWRHRSRWMQPKACRPADLPTHPTRDLRLVTFPHVLHAGWHLSYYGSPANWEAKLSAFAHEEVGMEFRDVLHDIANGAGGYEWRDHPLVGPLRDILDDIEKGTAP